MKILLTQEVKNLGKPGEIKEVSNGYARNFLLPKKMAVLATEANVREVEIQKEKMLREEEKKRKNLLNLAERLNQTSITIKRQAGENDKLFGSVTSIDIANALANENLNVNKKDILLKEPLKSLGIYNIPVKLSPDIEATIKLWIIKE